MLPVPPGEVAPGIVFPAWHDRPMRRVSIGFALGLVVGLGLASLRRVPERTGAQETPTVTRDGWVSAPRSSHAVPPSPAEDANSLRAENALLRKIAEDLERELHGFPIAWPTDTPPAQREAFVANVTAALEACAVDSDLVGSDCSEPPCYVMLRNHDEDFWDRFVNNCPGWVTHYTNAVSMASDEIDCGDGRTENALLLGSNWYYSTQIDDVDAEAKENFNRRLQTRVDEMKARWTCAPP